MHRGVTVRAEQGMHLCLQHFDVRLGLLEGKSFLEVALQVLLGVGEQGVGDEGYGGNRALNVQHDRSWLARVGQLCLFLGRFQLP